MNTALQHLLDAANVWEEAARARPEGPRLAPVIERGVAGHAARVALEQALGRWLEDASVAVDAAGEVSGGREELGVVVARLGPWGALDPEGPRGEVWEDLRLAEVIAGAGGPEVGARVRRLAPRVGALGLPLWGFAGPWQERLLGAALALAEGGSAGAARLAIRLDLKPGPLLDRFRALGPDLARAWAERHLRVGHADRVLEAAREGLVLPRVTLFEARRRAGQAALAWAGLFPLPGGVDPVRLWDEAIEAGELELLRAAARESGDRLGTWLAADEPGLCVLPGQRYDHEQVKAVTAYAVARLGLPPGPAESAWLPAPLVARLAAAPGPHDPARCLDAALAGYERLVAFHVAGRSRARYARAAAYWRAHAALCAATGQAGRHAVLGARFAEELRRLPALRAEVEGR